MPAAERLPLSTYVVLQDLNRPLRSWWASYGNEITHSAQATPTIKPELCNQSISRQDATGAARDGAQGRDDRPAVMLEMPLIVIKRPLGIMRT
jgi:hypothetical protein